MVTGKDHPGHVLWGKQTPQLTCLQLPQLMFDMADTNSGSEYVPSANIADQVLQQNPYKYGDTLSCMWHKEHEMVRPIFTST